MCCSAPCLLTVFYDISPITQLQVGNGECWTLASEALKAAGARHAMGYNFGQVIPLEEVSATFVCEGGRVMQ